ncbi:MAG TPA: GWxTD domain-containing protein [Bacteroidales bacterium]|nr:GWxTD domain-containing protein [Bacteroidales bacterium]HSA44737.1 GWxTD domain-containing protein [Bacteroidales bacterium]
MKKLIFLLLLLPVCSFSSAQNIQAALSYCSFYSVDDGPFLETYLSVYAGSIVFQAVEPGAYQGLVGVTMIFRNEENIVNFKKYELKSPVISDTLQRDFSFIDQQRFTLPNGDYEFEIQIRDLHTAADPIRDVESLKIDFPQGQVSISGIELLESFKKSEEINVLSKSGYDLVPYLQNFYPREVNKLAFYSEIYGSDQVLGSGQAYLLSWHIRSNETGKTLSEFARNKKETARPVNVILHEFDISKLPSGNYDLVVEARNQQNQVFASNSLFFQRSNPEVKLDMKDVAALDIRGSFVEQITNTDSLSEYIRSLAPVSTEMEIVFAQNQLRTADLLTMQQYFLNFWIKRDEFFPERAWLKYKEQVNIVNHSYKTPIKKGYETDRGRIYLKYGAPNTITDQPFESSSSGLTIVDGRRDGDMGTVPYQIWHYYQLTNDQRDKKFVFANPSLATNDYALIHSNVRGEINNPNWQSDLIRQIGLWDKDEISPRGRFGNKSGELFNNPR